MRAPVRGNLPSETPGHGDPPSEINGGRFAAARRFFSRALGPGITHGRGGRTIRRYRDLLDCRRQIRNRILWMALLSWPLMAAVQTCARGSGW